MDYFEHNERKHCGSRPYTPIESPQPRAAYVPRVEDLVEMPSITVTETPLTDEQLIELKLAHGIIQ